MVSLVFLGYVSTSSAYGSPTFGIQEISPIPSRAFNNAGNEVNPTGSAILKDVTFFSDGYNLNATYWTLDQSPNIGSSIITYGMLIDADSNDKTGYGGIDYIFKTQFEKNRVTNTLEELTNLGDKKIIYSNFKNPESFQNEKNSMSLSLDLRTIGSPEQYKISFFTNETSLDGKFSNIDYSSLASIPIPILKITIIPSQILVSPGEQRVVQVQVQSNSQLSHNVVLYVDPGNVVDGGVGQFIPYMQKVPSDGLITSNLKITIPNTIVQGQYPYYIHARADFDPSDVDTSQINDVLIKKFYRTHQEVLQNSFLEINIQNPSSFESVINYIFSFGGYAEPRLLATVLPVLVFLAIIAVSRYKKKHEKTPKKH